MGNDGFITLKEKDWEKATPEQRDWLVFNTLQSLDKRLNKLEQQRLFNYVLMFAGSAVGGALMMLVLIVLKVKIF